MSEATFEKIDFVNQAEIIEQILQQAVHRTLSIHKRLGNPVALWLVGKSGGVEAGRGLTVLPSDEIELHLDLGGKLGFDDEDLPEYFGDLLQYVQSVS